MKKLDVFADVIEQIYRALPPLERSTVNIVADAGANLSVARNRSQHKIVRTIAGSTGGEAATIVFFPLVMAATVAAGPLAGFGVYVVFSATGAAAGKLVYDVLYWGTEQARDALVEILSDGDSSNGDIVSRSYTHRKDGTTTEYLTRREGGSYRAFVSKRDLFGRVVGTPFNYLQEDRGIEKTWEIVTSVGREKHLETFMPRRVALMGKDGNWYALDLETQEFFTVNPDEGRIKAPTRFETPDAWAEVFGLGSLREEDLIGIVSQENFVRFRDIGTVMEDARPKTPGELERARLQKAREELEAAYPHWHSHWPTETRVALWRDGKNVRTFTFSYDQELGRFVPLPPAKEELIVEEETRRRERAEERRQRANWITNAASVVARNYRYAEDGTTTEYVTHRDRGALQTFVITRDVFGRQIGEARSYRRERRPDETPMNLIGPEGREKNIETFEPKYIALAGRDGEWYAFDEESGGIYSVDPESGRILTQKAVSLDEPGPWAKVFGEGTVTQESLIGILSQEDPEVSRRVVRRLEGMRPRTVEELQRARYEKAKAAVEAAYPNWSFDWISDDEVVVTWPGKSVRSVPLSYDKEAGRFWRTDVGMKKDASEEGEDRGQVPDKPGQALKSAIDNAGFDVSAAAMQHLERMQEARRGEAFPPTDRPHMPQGRLLLTSAQRFLERRGAMWIPFQKKRLPSRAERHDEAGAFYGEKMRHAKTEGEKQRVREEFVASHLAIDADQDQRDRETAWAQATKADPEIGGKNLKDSLMFARYALDHFGDVELYDFLDDTGLGNHPEVIRMFMRVGVATEGDRTSRPMPPPRPGWENRKRPKTVQWLGMRFHR